ncbi:hypothetical protein HAX54_021062, partial [Datura stramonium]|nr:hypothetical protein [Datura stramonium]
GWVGLLDETDRKKGQGETMHGTSQPCLQGTVELATHEARCDGQLNQSRSAQVRLSSDNVVQATGSACLMKKVTTMGDEGDMVFPYRCSTCNAIQMMFDSRPSLAFF